MAQAVLGVRLCKQNVYELLLSFVENEGQHLSDFVGSEFSIFNFLLNSMLIFYNPKRSWKSFAFPLVMLSTEYCMSMLSITLSTTRYFNDPVSHCFYKHTLINDATLMNLLKKTNIARAIKMHYMLQVIECYTVATSIWTRDFQVAFSDFLKCV